MYKILLVDDEILVIEALKIMLEELKDEITIIGEAHNGREAIELDRNLNPDIIFMDIKMPGIDGIKASEIIKKQNKNKIIIMVTAYDDFALIHKALTLGVNDYILKPFKCDNLAEVLRNQMDNLKSNTDINENKAESVKCSNSILEPALKYIEENYTEQILLKEVAKISNVSLYYFSKLFKKEMGMNFSTYVTRYKIKKAKEMLRNTDLLIANIASGLGYYECGYFTKVFRKIEGVTPTAYRNMNNKHSKLF